MLNENKCVREENVRNESILNADYISTTLEELVKSDKTKSEKVILFLESIGCAKEIFKRINNFEDVELQKMKDNIMLLTSFDLTPLETDLVVGGNLDLIDTDTDRVQDRINDLRSTLDDNEIIKSIIVQNPFILTDVDVLSADYISGVLTEFDFDIDEQKSILEEVPHIFMLNKNVLKESLHMIARYFNYSKTFKEMVLYEPSIIGITDESFLKENLTELGYDV